MRLLKALMPPDKIGFFGIESQCSDIGPKFKPVCFSFVIFTTKTEKMGLNS